MNPDRVIERQPRDGDAIESAQRAENVRRRLQVNRAVLKVHADPVKARARHDLGAGRMADLNPTAQRDLAFEQRASQFVLHRLPPSSKLHQYLRVQQVHLSYLPASASWMFRSARLAMRSHASRVLLLMCGVMITFASVRKSLPGATARKAPVQTHPAPRRQSSPPPARQTAPPRPPTRPALCSRPNIPPAAGPAARRSGSAGSPAETGCAG